MLLAVISAAFVVLGASAALGGSEPDPDTGDSDLGTSNGLRYSADPADFDPGNLGYATSTAGCGLDDWHVVGGGARLSGLGAEDRTIPTTTPYDWYDVDMAPEDGWRSSGYGKSAGVLESLAICQAEPQPNYLGGEVPDSPDSVRSAKQECGADNGSVLGGGGSIATSESFVSQSYPYDGPDSNSAPDDGWALRVYDTVGGQGGQVHLAGSHPVDDGDLNSTPDDGWKASAFNDSSRNRTLTAYAACIG